MGTERKKITVLFCQSDSIYKKLGCDIWDERRDALNWTGTEAAIYHPPCRLWSRLRAFSTADPIEKYLAMWSVRKVRSYGGILEHPKASLLFKQVGLPLPGQSDEFGFTIELDQYHFGHKAQKSTWLYICGIEPGSKLLNYSRIPGSPKYVFSTSKSLDAKPELNAKERSATPIRFAKWLVKICTEINNLKQ